MNGKWNKFTDKQPGIGESVIVAGKMRYSFEPCYTLFVDVAEYLIDGTLCTFNDWYEGQDEYIIEYWMPLPLHPGDCNETK